jgi:hypothetical protein
LIRLEDTTVAARPEGAGGAASVVAGTTAEYVVVAPSVAPTR